MKIKVGFFIIMLAMFSVSLAAGDMHIIIKADLSKIQIVSGKSSCLEEAIFENSKAVWYEYGNFYFAFYTKEALKNLVSSDSAKVFLAPYQGTDTPPVGGLYLVMKNIFGNIGSEVYGLEEDAYYVWPVEFKQADIELKDEKGNIFYKGFVPFGDGAIETIKLHGQKISKDFFLFSKK